MSVEPIQVRRQIVRSWPLQVQLFRQNSTNPAATCRLSPHPSVCLSVCLSVSVSLCLVEYDS